MKRWRRPPEWKPRWNSIEEFEGEAEEKQKVACTETAEVAATRESHDADASTDAVLARARAALTGGAKRRLLAVELAAD